MSDTAFLVVTGAANTVRDLNWIRRHIPEGAHCVVTDVTSGEACVAVIGPRIRDLLQPLTDTDLSNERFPFATARQIDLAMASARAQRIPYVGELGWELYVPSEMAAHVFDTLIAAGEPHGLRLCGMHVLDSCRIEKAFRHFSHDISDEDHVLEAGLGFAVKPNKQTSCFGEFIGRKAVLEKKQAGLSRRLLQFKLNDAGPLLYHTEPIWRDASSRGI